MFKVKQHFIHNHYLQSSLWKYLLKKKKKSKKLTKVATFYINKYYTVVFFLWHRVNYKSIYVHGASLHSEPFKCFSDVKKERTNIQISGNDISRATFLPISSFCQLISYNEVCLFGIIKNIVNIYINCTTYIQIHTVLYSKYFTSVLLSCSTIYSKLNKLFGYLYSVVQTSKIAFTNDTCQRSHMQEDSIIVK